jgi:prepilin-type N-terminal cleavage/methylation domain-containing protein
MRWKRRLHDPSGFTLVEVMVAILLLSIGVLGSIALADGANRATTRTKAREGATNVSRDVLEGVHAVPWTSLTPANATAKVQAIAGLGDADAGKAGWQIDRRGTTYTVALTVCSVDDASDGFAASHDATFCATAGTSAKPADSNPVDYRRATVSVSWSDQQGARSLTQATTVTNIDNGPGVGVKPTTLSPAPYVYSSTAGTSIGFDVTTDQPANNVDWLLSGTKQGAASGSSTAWNFTWPIGAATGGQAVGKPGATPGCSPTGTGKLDGTYFLGAQAYASSGLSAGPQAATVTLNRCVPLAPKGVAAGKSTALNKLEVQWDDNQEDDIAGYYVYRSTALNGTYSLVAAGGCSGLAKKTNCLDTDPAVVTVGVPYWYRVVAVDRDTGGTLREGDNTQVAYLTTNSAPTTPTIYNGSSYTCGVQPCTLVWPLSTDPNAGDTIAYYWVYRLKSGTPTYANRWDATETFTPQGVGWNDPDPTGGPWNYYVTAVDNRGNESAFSNLVTK